MVHLLRMFVLRTLAESELLVDATHQAICNYFGNGDIPIAALKPLTNETYFDDEDFL